MYSISLSIAMYACLSQTLPFISNMLLSEICTFCIEVEIHELTMTGSEDSGILALIIGGTPFRKGHILF